MEIRNERRRRRREKLVRLEVQALFFFLSFSQAISVITAEINIWGLVVVTLIMKVLSVKRHYEEKELA